MENLIIENPTAVLDYQISWENVKNHILKVVNTFPTENRIISNAENKLIIFKPLPKQSGVIPNDRILHITKWSENTEGLKVHYEISNQLNKITSYTEQELLKNTMVDFLTLIQMSITGSLQNRVKEINSQANNAKSLSGVMQLLILIAAISAIIVGAKACAM